LLEDKSGGSEEEEAVGIIVAQVLDGVVHLPGQKFHSPTVLGWWLKVLDALYWRTSVGKNDNNRNSIIGLLP